MGLEVGLVEIEIVAGLEGLATDQFIIVVVLMKRRHPQSSCYTQRLFAAAPACIIKKTAGKARCLAHVLDK